MCARAQQKLSFLRFGCPISRYERLAFRKCLYWHARLVASMIWILNPNFFSQDLKFIQLLGESSDVEEARLDLLNFQDTNLDGKPYLSPISEGG
jgi:hypothetical protein